MIACHRRPATVMLKPRVGSLAHRLRLGTPAVLGRLRDGKLVLDVRTVFSVQEESLLDAVRQAVREIGSGKETV